MLILTYKGNKIMRYLHFEKLFHDNAFFSLAEICLIDPGFDRRRLSEWQQKGYIRKIINGFYHFTDRPISDCIRVAIFPL
jgi:hypothetical protein